MPVLKTQKLLLGLLIALATSATTVLAQGYLHPGIDIKPHQVDAVSNLVYTTHAGFVTYAGPAPTWMKEKGWVVQVESDFNRDNVPEVITRYTHLYPNALMVNDVHYRREVFTPGFYLSQGRSLPYGNGPYVTRNQLIGIMGDSGSPTRTHIQYEIVTSRSGSLFGANLSKFNCADNLYPEQCSDDPARPGVFFAINRQKPDSVRAPVYVNPGIVTPQPAREPRVFPVHPAPRPELPEPPLAAPDFRPPPPPPLPPATPPPVSHTDVLCEGRVEDRTFLIDSDGYLRAWGGVCGGHWGAIGYNCGSAHDQTCTCNGGGPGGILPPSQPCDLDGDGINESQCDNAGLPDWGGPMCWEQGCVSCTSYDIFVDPGTAGCTQQTVNLSCPAVLDEE